jgi:acetyl esterase/lipase
MATEILDVSYVRNGHERQKLDLYLPQTNDNGNGNSKQRIPLIVYIHGGAFAYGSKRTDLMPKRLQDHGYAIASLDYRLSGDAIFPASVEDCKAAVRWLRAHADQYGFNPDKFIAWGESAGGHQVAMLGTTADRKEFDVGDYLEFSSAVQGVVDYYGPSDFLQMDAHAPPTATFKHGAADSPESRYLGGTITEHHDRVKRANPITYVSSKTCPFFVAHGTADSIVPYNQSELLVSALRDSNVPVEFHPVEGAEHVFGGMSDEQSKVLYEATDAFMGTVLHG